MIDFSAMTPNTSTELGMLFRVQDPLRLGPQFNERPQKLEKKNKKRVGRGKKKREILAPTFRPSTLRPPILRPPILRPLILRPPATFSRKTRCPAPVVLFDGCWVFTVLFCHVFSCVLCVFCFFCLFSFVFLFFKFFLAQTLKLLFMAQSRSGLKVFWPKSVN